MNKGRGRLITIAVSVAILVGAIASVGAEAPANGNFQQTWARTDRPVADGQADRTWMWGPEAFTGTLTEPYAESPDGQRTVQYYDKARMEITHPDSGDPDSIWYVTNGLLVVELVTGRMQVGDTEFEDRTPAAVNVAGDAGDPDSPTYASFGAVLHAAPHSPGATITQRIARDGSVTDDPSLADQGVSVAIVDDVTNHSIAAPFWEFMNSSGVVYQNGQYVSDTLFQNPYFATGRPITEPYWANVAVAGSDRLVLMQCFERRCLTYTPDNPPGFVTEAGNVGRHYHQWRYDEAAQPQPEPTPTPPPPEPTPTPTPPPPEPTSEPTAPEVVVEQWTLSEASYGGTAHIMGEVVNRGDTKIQDVEIVVTLYDDQETIISSEEVYDVMPIISAGGESPFRLIALDIPPSEIADVRFQVDFEVYDPDSFTAEYYSTDFATVQAQWLDDRITGEIRNNGDEEVDLVSILVIGYTDAGEIFGVESGSADLDAIPAGGTSPFTINVFDQY